MKKRFVSLFALLLALVAAPIANAQPPSPFVHTVQRGDYWYALARRYGVSLNVLLRTNPDLARHPKLFLFTGQQVIIPKDVDHTPSYTEPFLYVVQSGDSVANLAQRFEQYQFYIANANGLEQNGTLTVGELLLIPAGPHAHYIKAGETVDQIAALYGIAPDALLRLYPDANHWKTGSMLHIPIQYDQLLLPIVPDAPTATVAVLPQPTVPPTASIQPTVAVPTSVPPTAVPTSIPPTSVPQTAIPTPTLPQPVLLTAVPTESVLLVNNLLTPSSVSPTATPTPPALSQLAIQQVVVKQQTLRTTGDMVTATIGVLPLGGQAPYVLLLDGLQVSAQSEGELVFEVTAACGDGVVTNFTVTVQDIIGQQVSAKPAIPLLCLTR